MPKQESSFSICIMTEQTKTTKKKFSIICLECGESATIEQLEDENYDGDLKTCGALVSCTSCTNTIWSINNDEI